MGGAFTKGEVRRAGAHLARRMLDVRQGERSELVDEADTQDALAREVVDWWRAQHIQPMLRVAEVVRGAGATLDVVFRLKQFRTTIDKLTREPGKLADMVDIGGVRAVFDTQEEVDEFAAVVGGRLDVRRVRDWARSPRASGYRAVHLHVRHQEHWVEVQLRTFGQDAWANIVENEGRLSGHAYKAGRGPAEVLEFFSLVAALIATLELGEAHPDLAARLAGAHQRARSHLVTPMLKDLL